MVGFKVDMSPLERSSMNIGRTLIDAGKSGAAAIRGNQQYRNEQQEQGDIEAFMRQAMDGDQVALKELMVKSPQAAQMVAQHIQSQQAGQQAEQDRFTGEIANNTAGFVEQMHTAPQDQQEAMFNAAVDDPRYDIDEEDRGLFMDVNARKALVGQVKGKEYAESFFGGDDAGEGFTLSQGQQRFDAQGRPVARVAPKETAEQINIPEVLLEGLSPDLSTKASAAYTAAGGGKDGMQAYQKQVDKGTEQEKRLASPAILKSNFPKASVAEMAQLQGTMDAARTTETGLKAASKVREEQKRLVKAKGFQNRAVELLTNIISSEDLGDVTGSLEGAYDFRPFSDDESELIADIEEAGNILTADNLSLMSGVLSESDIKILKNLAGGGLIRTRSEKRFKEDVTKLRDKLASQMVVTTDERAGGGDNIDSQAMQWAKDNPNDPRAAAIMQKLQGK